MLARSALGLPSRSPLTSGPRAWAEGGIDASHQGRRSGSVCPGWSTSRSASDFEQSRTEELRSDRSPRGASARVAGESLYGSRDGGDPRDRPRDRDSRPRGRCDAGQRGMGADLFPKPPIRVWRPQGSAVLVGRVGLSTTHRSARSGRRAGHRGGRRTARSPWRSSSCRRRTVWRPRQGFASDAVARP